MSHESLDVSVILRYTRRTNFA